MYGGTFEGSSAEKVSKRHLIVEVSWQITRRSAGASWTEPRKEFARLMTLVDIWMTAMMLAATLNRSVMRGLGLGRMLEINVGSAILISMDGR
jgi:hypothetical protein